MSAQADYGQIGAAIARLRRNDLPDALGSASADLSVANLLEALLEMHSDTALDLDHFPQVDAVARVIATDFDCCSVTTTVEDDPVNHPGHYTSHPSGVECIEITEHMGFNLGNAVKYIWRADEKGNALEDLEKARWYIERELERRAKQ